MGESTLETRSDPLDAALAYLRFWSAMAFTVVFTVVMFAATLFGLLVPGDAGRRWQLFCARTWAAGIRRRTRLAVLDLHRMAGAGPSPLEPMIAPAGKRSGERA
jgi:hypothetical protein